MNSNNDAADPAIFRLLSLCHVSAACSDWHIGDADSMPARDEYDPTLDAGYKTVGISH